ncbi:MAG: hypothetical protein ABW139_07730 [Candidatus Thiodiazotropha sp. DIVDIV]
MKQKSNIILFWMPLALLFILLILSDPLLANKFETIGGGVQGSNKVKIEYLQIIAYVASVFFLVSGILTIALHNKNALTLNYTMWKSSATIFFILSISTAAAGYFMS